MPARCATRGASSRRRVGCPQCWVPTMYFDPETDLQFAAVHRRWKSGKRKAGVGSLFVQHCGQGGETASASWSGNGSNSWPQVAGKFKQTCSLRVSMSLRIIVNFLIVCQSGPHRRLELKQLWSRLNLSCSKRWNAHSSAHAWLCTCELCWNPSNVPQQGSILCILVYTASLMLLRGRCQWKSIMAYV